MENYVDKLKQMHHQFQIKPSESLGQKMVNYLKSDSKKLQILEQNQQPFLNELFNDIQTYQKSNNYGTAQNAEETCSLLTQDTEDQILSRILKLSSQTKEKSIKITDTLKEDTDILISFTQQNQQIKSNLKLTENQTLQIFRNLRFDKFRLVFIIILLGLLDILAIYIKVKGFQLTQILLLIFQLQFTKNGKQMCMQRNSQQEVRSLKFSSLIRAWNNLFNYVTKNIENQFKLIFQVHKQMKSEVKKMKNKKKLFMRMVVNIQEKFQMIKDMVKVNQLYLMYLFMKVNFNLIRWKVKVNQLYKIVLAMKEIFLMDFNMDLAKKNFQMVQVIKVIIQMVRRMEKVNINGVQEVVIRDNQLMDIFKVLDSIYHLKILVIKVNGKITRNMVMVRRSLRMVRSIQDSTKVMSKMAMEFQLVKIKSMKDNLQKINLMVMEYLLKKMEHFQKVNGKMVI